jgi:hypothetical protein
MSQATGKVSSSHVSPRLVQLTHVAPPDPQSVLVVPAWQLFMASQQPEHVSKHGHAPPPALPKPVWQLPLPSQQPSGQVAGPHANPPQLPSRQKPDAGQLTHWVPPEPQSASVVPGWHVLVASQHPSQVSGLHEVVTQLASSHSWLKLHCTHASPPVPQSNTWLPGLHSFSESQQPVGHVVLLHLEFWQKPSGHDAALPLHVTQELPPDPQSVTVSPGWQMS